MLVLDRASVLSAVGNVQIATSFDWAFAEDSVGLRATLRFGAKIADTSRVVKLSVTAPGS